MTDRQRLLRSALIAAGAAALLFALATVVALEGNDVVILHTRGPDGAMRETRTWFAIEDGVLFVEAAHAERPFYLHLLADPEVWVEQDGLVVPYRATPVPNPHEHEHIRHLLAAKYGWADWWVGLLQDTSRSIEIRLEPNPLPE